MTENVRSIFQNVEIDNKDKALADRAKQLWRNEGRDEDLLDAFMKQLEDHRDFQTLRALFNNCVNDNVFKHLMQTLTVCFLTPEKEENESTKQYLKENGLSQIKRRIVPLRNKFEMWASFKRLERYIGNEGKSISRCRSPQKSCPVNPPRPHGQ